MTNLRHALLAAVMISPVALLAQQGQTEQKEVTIEIQRINEDGNHEIMLDELDGNADTDLKRILDKYQIEEGFGDLKPGEEFEVIIRKKTTESAEEYVELHISKKAEATQTGRPLLGITYNIADDGTGMEVTTVIPNSGAAKAGLQLGDIIRSVDKMDLYQLDQLSQYVSSKKPGDKVKLVVVQGEKERKITATLGTATPEMMNYNKVMERREEMHRRPVLGIYSKETTAEGVVISEVAPGSMADRLDLVEGDIITHINGRPTPDVASIAEEIADLKQNDKFSIVIRRNGEMLGMNDTWQTRHANRQAPVIEEEKIIIEDGEKAPQNTRIIKEVRVKVSFGTLEASEAQSMHEKTGMDFANADENLDIKVFPNPSQGNFEINIPFDEPGELTLRVFDGQGSEIEHLQFLDIKAGTFFTALNLSDQSAGTYYLLVNQNGKTYARKLVIQ